MIYVPGLLTGQLSGKAGSSLASKNPYATTVGVHRHRASPQTPKASTVRANFALLQALYSTLSTAQAQAWHDLGLTMFVAGRLSRSYTLTAPGAFMSVNRTLQTLGLPILPDAPALVRPSSAIITSLSASEPGTVDVDLNLDPLDGFTLVGIYGQRIRKGSILTPPRSSWQLVAVLPSSSVGPWSVGTEYVAICGPIVAGTTIWLNARPYSTSGFIGGASVASTVVA